MLRYLAKSFVLNASFSILVVWYMQVGKRQNKDQVGSARIAQLLDSFIIEGPNGRHVCMVFELYGPDLYSILPKTKYEGLPLPMVKTIMKQVILFLIQSLLLTLILLLFCSFPTQHD